MAQYEVEGKSVNIEGEGHGWSEIKAAYDKQYQNKPQDESFTRGLGRGVQNLTAGALRGANSLVNLPTDIARIPYGMAGRELPIIGNDRFTLGNQLAEKIEPNNQQGMDKFMQAVPETAISMMLPAAKGANFAQRAGREGLQQGGLSYALNEGARGQAGGMTGGMSAVTNPLSEFFGSSNKYARMAKRAILPAAGGLGAGYQASVMGLPLPMQLLAAYLGKKGGSKLMEALGGPEHFARTYGDKISPHLNEKEFGPAFDAAKKEGIHLTPAEASQKASVMSYEKDLGKSPEGKDLLQGFFEKRKGDVGKLVEKLQEKVSPKKFDKLREKRWEEVKSAKVSPQHMHEIRKIAGNVDVNDAMKAVGKKDKFIRMSHKDRLQNAEFIIETKKLLQQKASNLKSKTQSPKKGSSFQSDAIDMNNAADMVASFVKQRIDPAKTALTLSQKKIASDKIGDLFKTELEGGTTFVNALKKRKFRADLDKMLPPRNRQYLGEVHSILSNINQMSPEQLAKSLPNSMSSTKGQDPIELAESFMKMFKSGKYDEAAIKLSLDPEWPKKLAELNKVTNKEKRTAEFVKMISRGVSNKAGQLQDKTKR